MPGHQRTNVDVQFGNWEFGTDSSPFSFGSSETTAVDGITNTLSSRWVGTSGIYLKWKTQESYCADHKIFRYNLLYLTICIKPDNYKLCAKKFKFITTQHISFLCNVHF